MGARTGAVTHCPGTQPGRSLEAPDEAKPVRVNWKRMTRLAQLEPNRTLRRDRLPAGSIDSPNNRTKKILKPFEFGSRAAHPI